MILLVLNLIVMLVVVTVVMVMVLTVIAVVTMVLKVALIRSGCGVGEISLVAIVVVGI